MKNFWKNYWRKGKPLLSFVKLCLLLVICESNGLAQLVREPNTTLNVYPQSAPSTNAQVTLTDVFPGLTFTRPVAIAIPPGETNRMFVVERDGRIMVIDDLRNPTKRLFMDISSRVTASDWVTDRRTEGLSSLAFHPDFQTNGRFFVTYNTLTNTAQGDGNYNRVSEFRASADHQTGLADSETIYINQYDIGEGHNINQVTFGPDGYLYIATGDEGDGGTGDDYNNAQHIDKNFFSAIMRIDVDKLPGNLPPNPHPANSDNYYIPADNPFVGATSFNGLSVDPAQVRDEFWAVGFRNPWRFSFDPLTGEIYEGDVGQHTREEINHVVKGGNYGWSFKEGKTNGPKAPVPPGVDVIDPLVDYSTGFGPDWGFSVTCGVVYRGTLYPSLYGKLIYADYVSGNVWALDIDAAPTPKPVNLLTRTGIAGFGWDPRNGNVLAVDHDRGKILALIDTNSSSITYPDKLSATGIFANLATLQPNTGIYPYDVNVSFWSDGASKKRWFSIPTDKTMRFSAAGNWIFPTGGVWIKHFELETISGDPSSSRRIETRVLVNGSKGLYGLTYKWDATGEDATLVPAEGEDQVYEIQEPTGTRTQTWRFPSRSQCLSCHTAPAGYVLGFNTAQMNRAMTYGDVETNQISALAHAGFFENPPTSTAGFRTMARADDESVSLTYRVKSYLAANCVYCHQPEGSAHTAWDARLSTALPFANIINGTLANTLGDTNNQVVVPNDPAHSTLLTRISIRGRGQMPPLASKVVDEEAVKLLTDWITKELPNYQSYSDWTNLVFNGQMPDAEPGSDPDGDGAKNYSEYLSSSDPLDALSKFAVEFSQTNSTATFRYEQPANRSILIDFTTDLQKGTWSLLENPANQTSFPAVSTNRVLIQRMFDDKQYFRIRIEEP